MHSDARLAQISRVVRDTENEDTARLRLDAMLIDAVDAEQAYANAVDMNFLGDRKPVCLAPETFLSLEVMFNGELRLMRGRSDYTVWCGDKSLSSHQIAIEAKALNNSSQGFPQCLGYMGKFFSFVPKSPLLRRGVYFLQLTIL